MAGTSEYKPCTTSCPWGHPRSSWDPCPLRTRLLPILLSVLVQFNAIHNNRLKNCSKHIFMRRALVLSPDTGICDIHLRNWTLVHPTKPLFRSSLQRECELKDVLRGKILYGKRILLGGLRRFENIAHAYISHATPITRVCF